MRVVVQGFSAKLRVLSDDRYIVNTLSVLIINSKHELFTQVFRIINFNRGIITRLYQQETKVEYLNFDQFHIK